MNRARGKLSEFRDDFRRGLIDSYFKAKREQLVAQLLPEIQRLQLNQQIIQMIQRQNIPQLYRVLYYDKKQGYQQTSKPAMLSLTSQTLLPLLNYLIKNMDRLDSMLILNNVIDLQYQMIFLNRQNQELNQQIVRNLYQLCNSYVGIKDESKQNKNMVNACLNCIKSLLYNKDVDSDGWNFTQVIKTQYVVGYLLSWLEKLIENPIYLITITLVEYDIQISSNEIVKQYLDHSPHIIIKLLLQSDPQNNYLKSCALPSLSLASSFIKNISDKSTLFKIVQPCLATSKAIYALTQTAGQQFYRMNTFMYILRNVADIFEKLEAEVLASSLVEEMQAQNYWIFCVTLLRTETYRTRQVVFRILLSAIRGAIIAKVKLQNYITQTAIGLFVEGLEINLDEIAVSAMQIFVHLYRYTQDHVQQTVQMREWIDMFEIQAGLQNLQHSKNKEISQSASRLLSMKKQFQKVHRMQDQNQ